MQSFQISHSPAEMAAEMESLHCQLDFATGLQQLPFDGERPLTYSKRVVHGASLPLDRPIKWTAANDGSSHDGLASWVQSVSPWPQSTPQDQPLPLSLSPDKEGLEHSCLDRMPSPGLEAVATSALHSLMFSRCLETTTSQVSNARGLQQAAPIELACETFRLTSRRPQELRPSLQSGDQSAPARSGGAASCCYLFLTPRLASWVAVSLARVSIPRVGASQVAGESIYQHT